MQSKMGAGEGGFVVTGPKRAWEKAPASKSFKEHLSYTVLGNTWHGIYQDSLKSSRPSCSVERARSSLFPSSPSP